MKNKKSYLTESEWGIIQVVWERQPCSAPEVTEVLESTKGWSYSTVKTFMDRMVNKGLLRAERIRNLMLYRAVVSKAEAQYGEIKRAVKRAFDGALTPMMQFLLDSDELTAQQLDELETMIKNKAKRSKLRNKKAKNRGNAGKKSNSL